MVKPSTLVPFQIAILLVALSACSDDPAAPGTNADVVLDGGDTMLDGLSLPDSGDDEATEDGSTDDLGTVDAADEPIQPIDMPDEGLGLGEECGFGGPRCAEPLICIGTCQIPCDAGCPPELECIEVGDWGGVCGTVVGEGDECDFATAVFCDDGLFCNDDGVCEATVEAPEGDPCGGGAECEEGTSCVYTAWDEGICHLECENDEECGEDGDCVEQMWGSAVCFEDCDPDTGNDCENPEDYECRTVGWSGDDYACQPRRGDPPGELVFGDECGGEELCGEDLFCIDWLPGSYCTQNCEEPTDCPAIDGADVEPDVDCMSAGVGPGLCVLICDNDDDCPFTDMRCEDLWGMAKVCSW